MSTCSICVGEPFVKKNMTIPILSEEASWDAFCKHGIPHVPVSFRAVSKECLARSPPLSEFADRWIAYAKAKRWPHRQDFLTVAIRRGAWPVVERHVRSGQPPLPNEIYAMNALLGGGPHTARIFRLLATSQGVTLRLLENFKYGNYWGGKPRLERDIKLESVQVMYDVFEAAAWNRPVITRGKRNFFVTLVRIAIRERREELIEWLVSLPSFRSMSYPSEKIYVCAVHLALQWHFGLGVDRIARLACPYEVASVVGWLRNLGVACDEEKLSVQTSN